MQHRTQNDLTHAPFKSAVSVIKTPEGRAFGAGTTVGNSIEGWAPSALFVHTDGGAFTRVYINHGTKATADWVPLNHFQDDQVLMFGTGLDLGLKWNGTYMVSSPPSGLWADAPSPLDPDPYKAIVLFDDFLLGNDPDTPLAHWVEVDDSTTGTNIPGDIRGGSEKIVTAGVDNDYHALRSMSKCFNCVDAKELWFEARFRLVEAATSESAWWFGLTSSLTTGGFQADALGPLGTYDGILVSKDEDTMLIDVETSNASSQDTEANIATFVTNTWTRIGFHVSAAATTAIVRAYYDVAAGSGALTAHGTTMNLTRSGLQEMHVVMGVKSKGSAETLEVDYVKCVQLR